MVLRFAGGFTGLLFVQIILYSACVKSLPMGSLGSVLFRFSSSFGETFLSPYSFLHGKRCFLGNNAKCLLQFPHRVVFLHFGGSHWWVMDLNVILCDYFPAIRFCRKSFFDAFKHHFEFADRKPILLSLLICCILCLLPRRIDNFLLLLYRRRLNMYEIKFMFKKKKSFSKTLDFYIDGGWSFDWVWYEIDYKIINLLLIKLV